MSVTLLFSDAADEAGPGKRELTKAQNRDAILKAARAVFSELGYEAASVRDIIRRTGLASGTFYNYYRSKEEVAKALVADVGQRLRPILRAQREQAHDFESYLNGAIRAYFQFIVDELRNWGPGRPRADRNPYIKVQTPGQSAVFEEIQASINLVLEHGLGPHVDTEFLTAAVIGVAQNIGEKMLARDPIDLDAAADFAVNLILHGLSALPRREPA
jgi:AcrR family transcriptional regulator